MNPKFRPLLETVVFSGIVFIAHVLLLQFLWKDRTVLWQHSIFTIYAYFFVCAVATVFALIRIKQKNIDSVGNTFMLLTCIKTVLAYALLHPILNAKYADVGFEKGNFFAVFAFFLAIETIVSVRMLQKTGPRE